MKYVKFLAVLIFSALFLPSCFFGGGGGLGGDLTVLPSETDLRADTRDNRRRAGATGANRCENNRDCVDSCEDVYDEEYSIYRDNSEADGNVDACIELSYRVAIQFEDILEVIEDPYISSLRNIEGRAFESFLEISVGPWVEAAEGAGEDEAEVLLAWITGEPRIAGGIVAAYRDNYENVDQYEGVWNLFEGIASGTDCNRACRAISHTSIVGDRTFYTLADNEGNTSALCIAKDIFEQKCDSSQRTSVDDCQEINSFNGNCSTIRVASGGGGSGGGGGGGISSDFDVDALQDATVAISWNTYTCDENLTNSAQDEIDTCSQGCYANNTNAIDILNCLDDDEDSTDTDCATGSDYKCELSSYVGSGVYESSSTVLTNHHVVEDYLGPVKSGDKWNFAPPSLPFIVENYGGSTEVGEAIVWHDGPNDLALVRLGSSMSGVEVPTFGSLADLNLLDRLVTMGTPAGVQWTASSGELTNKSIARNRCQQCISFSIPIGGGNSGGPVVNEQGELVALVAGRVLHLNGNPYNNLSYGPHIDIIKTRINTPPNNNFDFENLSSRRQRSRYIDFVQSLRRRNR